MGLPKDASGFWRFCFLAFKLLTPLVCRFRVEGSENVPSEGGVVLACNHPGGLDSFVLGYATPRQVFYMAKRELFNIHPIASYFLYRLGAFPIHRGARDAAAIAYSVKLLRQGRILGMYPEGTRNRGKPLRRGKSGAVRIAIEAGAPIVPVAVLGIPQLHSSWFIPWKRPEVSVRFGAPMRSPSRATTASKEGEEGQGVGMDAITEYTNEVMQAVAEMMPLELRGHYGSK